MTKSSSGKKLLSFSDDPMFRRVMRDEEIAKGSSGGDTGRHGRRGRLLQHRAGDGRRAVLRGIRLDAYVANSDAVYDIEMGDPPGEPRQEGSASTSR